MKSSEFAAAYQNQHIWIKEDSDPLRQSFLDKTTEVSNTLSNLVTAYLAEGPFSELPSQLDSQINQAGRFVVTHKAELLKKDTLSNNADGHFESIQEASTYLTVNRIALELWKELLTGKNIGMKTILDTQVQLAATAVNMMRGPLEDHAKGELYEWLRSHYGIKTLDNITTMAAVAEIDTFVAMLETCKSRRGLVVLPSPAKFENSVNNKHLNTDLLMFDTANDQVHGIQVKLKNRRYFNPKHGFADKQNKYNSELVTVIDSEQDLKNFIYVRDPNSGNSIVAPMPGLYSAHFLLNQKNIFKTAQNGRVIKNQGFANFLMRAKYDARGMTLLAGSSNNHVTNHLANIALTKIKA